MNVETETKTWIDCANEKEEQRRESAKQEARKRDASWDILLPVLCKMHEAGCDPISYWTSSDYPTVNTRKGDLQEIRKLFGTMSVRMRSAINKETVMVSLRAEYAPGIDFDYKTELDPNGECTINQEHLTTYSLVCLKGA